MGDLSMSITEPQGERGIARTYEPSNLPLRQARGLTDAEWHTAREDSVAAANRNAMVALVSEYGLWIPRRDLSEWRPTKRVDGEIAGLWNALTIIATDGILGYFINREDDQIIYGHIQHFSGEVSPLFSLEGEKPIKTGKKRKGLLEQALERLQAATEGI